MSMSRAGVLLYMIRGTSFLTGWACAACFSTSLTASVAFSRSSAIVRARAGTLALMIPRYSSVRSGSDGKLARVTCRSSSETSRAGKRLHPVHNRVYDPASEAVQAFLASGAIGDVFLAQTVGLEPPQTVSVRPWLGTPAGGGGVLLAQAVHPAYVLRWLLGDVAEVACLTAARKVVEMTAEDTAVALLRFRSGAVGEMTGTFGLRAGPYEHGITLYGPEGYVEIHSRRGVQAIAPRRFDDREPHPLLPERGWGEGFTRLWEDYARGFATGSPTRVTDEDGKRAVEIILGRVPGGGGGAQRAPPPGVGPSGDPGRPGRLYRAPSGRVAGPHGALELRRALLQGAQDGAVDEAHPQRPCSARGCARW